MNATLRTTKGRKFPPEVLTAEEFTGLMRGCSLRAPTGIRNRALLTVGYRAGLRISEALALQPKDIDPESGEVRVLFGKGGKSRTVALDVGACAIIQRWIDKRHDLGLNGAQRLFCTLHGRPMSRDYIRQLMPRLARRAGIEKRSNFHSLRHSFAHGLSGEGVPVEEIRRLLGHESLQVTGAYLAHIAPHDLVERIRNRPEWGKGL